MPVPLIDLTRDRAQLAEVEAAVVRVVRSGQYILGPEVENLERELQQYLGCKHAHAQLGNGWCRGFAAGRSSSSFAVESSVGVWRACFAMHARRDVAAFSCKGRGFCPSCGTRRMVDTAAWLVDRVIPEVPGSGFAWRLIDGQ